MRRISYPFSPSRSRRGGPRAVLSAFSAFLFLAALLVVAPITLLVSAPAQADTPLNTPFITWNMLGATTEGQALWTDYFPQLMQEAPATQVLMLQEAGPEAPDADVTTNPNPSGDGRVTYVVWNRGSFSRPDIWNIYFLQSSNPSVPGGRVNTIVMSRGVANQVMVVDNPMFNFNRPGRPALGIRLGNDWYFSFHALSGGGADAVGMLRAIGQAVARTQPPGVTYNYTVGADFNTEPVRLEELYEHAGIPTPFGNPPDIVDSGLPTHRSGRELDYAVTTTPNWAQLQANLLPNMGASDHDPVAVQATPARPALSTTGTTWTVNPTPVGGNATNGANASSALGNAGYRGRVGICMVQSTSSGACLQFNSPNSAQGNALAAAAGTLNFNYVGSVSAGNVAVGGDEEEAFPGESIAQIEQHLVTDLPVYKPDVILLQLDVASDLDSGVTASQEASALEGLLKQVYYILPNTTVLVGDPAPSANPATQGEMYSGGGSYIAQSGQVVTNLQVAGRRIQAVTTGIESNPGDLDSSQPDGVPNDSGYVAIAVAYANAISNLEQNGTIVDPGAVIVNPPGIIEDGSGIDDTGDAANPNGAPCDIYAAYGTQCAAAYSMTRAMYTSYDGPLYQVTRASDGTPADVGLLAAGGDVNASEQDNFCTGTTCTITKIYDQSGNGNNLTVAPSGGAAAADRAADASALPVTVGGGSARAYGLDVTQGVGYRDDSTTGVATGGAAEGMYMVASGTHANSGCCFDFGNVETNNDDDGAGTMDAVNFSTACPDGPPAAPCDGSGPWVEADLENGLFQEGSNTSNNTNEPSITSDFVTAMLKNDGTSNFELKGGDAGSGGLSTFWNGQLPPGADGGGQRWVPMKKQGAVEVGTGGDNSNSDVGSFFEGVITQGYPSDAADAAVQANIVAAGYGGNSAGLASATGTVTNGSGKCLDVNGNDTGGDLTPVDIWDCQSFAVDQHWTHNADGSLETLGKCLDIDGNSSIPGTLVELYACDGAGGQKWLQEPDGGLFNPQSGQCLDDPNGNTGNGTQLRIWYCNGASAQVWNVNGGNPIIGPAGKCLDVLGDDAGGNGTQVDIWDCQSFAVDQHWTLTPAGQLESLGKCLDIDGDSTTPGAKMELWTCDGAGGQVWRQQTDGSLVNPQSGLCLDDPSGNTANGTQLQVWTCDNLPPQVFTEYQAGSYLPAGVVTVGGNGGKCLDVNGNDTGADGTVVDVWDCQPWAVDQHWTRNPDGSLETLGRCLDIDGDSTTVGALVELWDCNGAGGQFWVQQPNGTLVNPQSGLCLEDPSGSGANGTQLKTDICDGSAAEKFNLTGGSPVRNTPSGKCIDVIGDDTGGNGSKVDLWDCQSYAADQHWTLTPGGQLETRGGCLDIDGDSTTAGALVELWTCDGAGGQVWRQVQGGALVNPQSGLCLDDPNGNAANGTQLRVWTCNGAGAQQFPVYDSDLYGPAGVVTIGGNAGKCLDVNGNDTGTDGTIVDVWDCQPSAVDQHWTHRSDGRLETMGRCLDIDGDSTAQGALVELWDCDTAGGQVWNQLQNGELYNPQSGMCLDDPNANQANGTQLRIWPCNSTTSAGGTVTAAQKLNLTGGNMVTLPSGQCMDVTGDDTGGSGSGVDLWGCQPYAIDQHWTLNSNGTISTLSLCLDSAGGGTAAGTPVVAATCDGSPTQEWTWQTVPEGTQNYAVLVNVGADLLCLTDPDGNTADGTQLQINNCSTSPSQEFNLG